MILITIFCIANMVISVYFIALFYERTDRASRDINAIASRLRIMEDSVSAHHIAYDFRIRVVENKMMDESDTGFTLPK
jgi:hypothetical protein